MNYVDKVFHNICSRELVPIYGFKRYRNTYYRIINDVFQSFNLHKSVSRDNCTVEFTLRPLCTDVLITKGTCGSDHLKIFRGTYDWFYYDNTPLSIEACFEEIYKYINDYLIGYFERGNNCANAYNEVLSFHRNFFSVDAVIHLNELYYFALKSEMYDEAIEHLLAIKNATIRAFERNKLFIKGNNLDDMKQRTANELLDYDNMISHISKRNTEYIYNLISYNERKNLHSLGIKTSFML